MHPLAGPLAHKETTMYDIFLQDYCAERNLTSAQANDLLHQISLDSEDTHGHPVIVYSDGKKLKSGYAIDILLSGVIL